MRLRALMVAGATMLAMALAGATGASAATEFGDTCSGNGGAPGDYTLTTLSAPPAALSLTAPRSGVITKVKVDSAISFPVPFPMAVKVLHPVQGNTYKVAGQQSFTAAPAGITVADARISVQTGDKLGLHGEPIVYEGTTETISLYCAGVEGGLGAVVGDVAPGSTAEFFEATQGRVPIVATIEPDGDNDGYGDETQDKCPQLASAHDACPLVVFDSYLVPGKSKVVVMVVTNTASPVTVSASVKLPKAAKKAKASATAKLTAATQTVTPGKLGRFVLKFPSSLNKALEELPKGKKLKMKVTAVATNVVGQVSEDASTVKLKG